jgi:hypothetical protein
MTHLNASAIARIGCLAATLCFIPIAEANKPSNPPGGGGGGDTSTRYRVVELPFRGLPKAISEISLSNTYTIAISSSDAGYGSSAFARVDANDQTVFASGFLPGPLIVDSDGVTQDAVGGMPFDVNAAGMIVGRVSVFDGNSSPGQAVVWSDSGSGYTYELLPRLANMTDSGAYGVNELGDIVGSNSKNADEASHAVVWDVATGAVTNLNTPATEALGWHLEAAGSINDDRLIAGVGTLGEATRGFILDYQSGAIWPVPLVGPVTSNNTQRINSNGRVIGSMWNGTGKYYGANPDYVAGYSWDLGETSPQILPPSNLNTSQAYELNDLGAAVGNTYIPTDDTFGIYSSPTLWEQDANGDVVTIDLNSQIPSRPDYLLVWGGGINNSGWIGVEGGKRIKGRYVWHHALLLIPNN